MISKIKKTSSIYNIREYEKKPLKHIVKEKGDFYSVKYQYTYNSCVRFVSLGYFNNIIDAIQLRDSFVSDWYGIDVSNISEEYLKKERSRYLKIGIYNILNGVLYDDNYNRIRFYGKSKTAQVNVSSDICSKVSLTQGEIENVFNGKKLALSGQKVCFFNGEKIIVEKLSDENRENSIKTKRHYRDRIFIKMENRKYFGTYKQTISESYSSVFIFKRKKTYIGNFSDPSESELAYFDYYYMFYGAKHSGDKRC